MSNKIKHLFYLVISVAALIAPTILHLENFKITPNITPTKSDTIQARKDFLTPEINIENIKDEKKNIQAKTSVSPVATSSAFIYYPVINVVDGDTIDVLIDEKKERVRLIGINTPEIIDPRKKVECFGKEASSFAHQMLEAKKVRLERDKTQDDRDKYKRLLRYVWREDGFFYNFEAIKLGYAYEYTYKIPYQYQNNFKEAEKTARENNAGLWASDTCNGKK